MISPLFGPTLLWQETSSSTTILPNTVVSNLPQTIEVRAEARGSTHASVVKFLSAVEAYQREERWRRAIPEGPVAAARRDKPVPRRKPSSTPTPNWPAMLRTFAGR